MKDENGLVRLGRTSCSNWAEMIAGKCLARSLATCSSLCDRACVYTWESSLCPSPEGAALIQPRAAPWESCMPKRISPERAFYKRRPYKTRPPFQGFPLCCRRDSQGVALGCISAAPLGRKRCAASDETGTWWIDLQSREVELSIRGTKRKPPVMTTEKCVGEVRLGRMSRKTTSPSGKSLTTR